jgi:hypothetical protein
VSPGAWQWTVLLLLLLLYHVLELAAAGVGGFFGSGFKCALKIKDLEPCINLFHAAAA